jgi:hypothetical protein
LTSVRTTKRDEERETVLQLLRAAEVSEAIVFAVLSCADWKRVLGEVVEGR